MGCVSKSHIIEKKVEKEVTYLLDKQTKKVSTFDVMNKSMRPSDQTQRTK